MIEKSSGDRSKLEQFLLSLKNYLIFNFKIHYKLNFYFTEEVKLKNEFAGPLALIKSKDDDSVRVVMPEKYNPDENSMSYYYDDSDEEIIFACTAYTDEEFNVKRKWNKSRDLLSVIANVLFFVSNDEMNLKCGAVANPSDKKTDEQCNKFGDTFMQVGYPVKYAFFMYLLFRNAD